VNLKEHCEHLRRGIEVATIEFQRFLNTENESGKILFTFSLRNVKYLTVKFIMTLYIF